MIKNISASGFRLQASGFIFKRAACGLQHAAKCHFVFTILIFGFIYCSAFAKEIAILYTGETHAMLYPCSCPIETDGGVARRLTLIKQLRKNNPDTLLLDSGGFFGGGLMDEYTQNTQLDMQRTVVNLKAMELMKYDAVTAGDDEFNFGREFFQENIHKTSLTFLSCNIDPLDKASLKILPYVVKEISGTKIGLIGVTTLSAMQKAGGLKFIEPKMAVKQAIEELKRKNADIIVLVSHLGESEDLNLIKDISGIDILIVGHSRAKEEPVTKIGNTLILRPSWQGRRLGKLSLTVTDNKITDYKAEELRLSDKISDDPDILSILPKCFSDGNCRKEGMIGVCLEPGALKSQCQFSESAKVSLLVITPKLCNICNSENVIKNLKRLLPGIIVSYLDYPDPKAAKLINDFGIKGLPVYLLGKETEKEKGFNNLRENLETKGNFYMLSPKFTGISYLLGRKKIKDKLDIFISLYDKNASQLLEATKDFNPVVHFLAVKQQDKFEAARGAVESEECLRSVCIQKYYPQKFWDYISCRAKFINSSWWEDCLGGLDTNKIKICSRGQEGQLLLEENINLNKELQIMFGPTYLLDNQEIFGLEGIVTKEEFRKIIKR